MKPKLAIVTDEPTAVDIYAAWKAEIAAIDWRKVHERKSEPVDLPDTRKRSWTK